MLYPSHRGLKPNPRSDSLSLFKYLCIYLPIYLYTYKCICRHAHIPTPSGALKPRPHEQLSLSLYVCVLLYRSIYLYTHTYICIHAYIHTYIYLYTRIYRNIHISVYTHIYTHTYICIHAYIHTHIYLYTRIYTRAIGRVKSLTPRATLQILAIKIWSDPRLRGRATSNGLFASVHARCSLEYIVARTLIRHAYVKGTLHSCLLALF